MSKKNIIIVLVILLALILFFKSNIIIGKDNLKTNKTATVSAPRDHSLLWLSPSQIKPDSQGNVIVSVLVDNRNVKVSTLEFTLFYDPTSIKFNDIQPQGIFKDAKVIRNVIHDRGSRCCQEFGKITYALQVDPNKAVTELSDDSPAVNISFNVLNSKRNTEVRFLEAKINSKNITDAIYKQGYNSIIKFDNIDSFDLK